MARLGVSESESESEMQFVLALTLKVTQPRAHDLMLAARSGVCEEVHLDDWLDSIAFAKQCTAEMRRQMRLPVQPIVAQVQLLDSNGMHRPPRLFALLPLLLVAILATILGAAQDSIWRSLGASCQLACLVVVQAVDTIAATPSPVNSRFRHARRLVWHPSTRGVPYGYLGHICAVF